ncbi:MAG: signal recognition particle protein [Phycisphaerales bacterium]|nr:signal recognition particle protein [Phycisphaerales bacterium]
MFERLSEGFSNAIRKLSGQATLTEANVREAMADVRTALLEADVHHSVVDEFCEDVIRDSLGQDVLKGLKPGQQMIGAVHDSLVRLMGGGSSAAERSGLGLGAIPGVSAAEASVVPRVSPGPTVVMMCGLQGSGKTTTCGKLAAYLKKRGRSVMVAAADLQRPAAVEQLRTVVEQVQAEMPGGAQVHFYGEPDKVAEYGRAVGAAVTVCQNALKAAIRQGVDTLILDTAGRLHINDELMTELASVQRATQPHQVYLVVDAMTGQDAVNSAKAFHDRLKIDGVVLTKFDSDTRGGAALTVRKVTGAPVKFIGVGEKLAALEEFHAERIAGRILGMGDVVSLVEKAQQEVSEEEAARMAEKMAKGELTMDDFLDQLRSLRRMGPMKQLLGLLPGVGSMLKDVQIDEKELDRVEGMVRSMTPEERGNVSKLDHSRRRRIAKGSGTDVNAVGQLAKKFEMVSKMTKQMAGMGMRGKLQAARQLQASGGVPGVSGLPRLGGKGGTHMASPKAKFKKRK